MPLFWDCLLHIPSMIHLAVVPASNDLQFHFITTRPLQVIPTSQEPAVVVQDSLRSTTMEDQLQSPSKMTMPLGSTAANVKFNANGVGLALIHLQFVYMQDLASGGFIGERQIPCDYVAVVVWEVFIVDAMTADPLNAKANNTPGRYRAFEVGIAR
ncbi:unnamed protein product [Sphagnum balticum]